MQLTSDFSQLSFCSRWDKVFIAWAGPVASAAGNLPVTVMVLSKIVVNSTVVQH